MAQNTPKKINPGDELRDQAAKLLSSSFGTAKIEKREEGKKADVYFETNDFGRRVRLYVEAKDYDRPLRRSEVVHIFADYSGILDSYKPASLLIVTRNGLSPDADKYVNVEQTNLRHQTILEIEVSSIDLDTYLQVLIDNYRNSGLSQYYVENGFNVRTENSNSQSSASGLSFDFNKKMGAYSAILEWVKDDTDFAPVAILGGYGSGKTSLASKLAAELAELSRSDLRVRRPILIKLGNIARYSAVDGILGGLFTSEIPVRNFNLPSFQILNEKGHFLIILDGFDEMKHSMNWSDFKAQVQTLLHLHKPKSKLLLLGRPSAFLSEDEERHILKGQRRLDEDWVRLPNWPRFHELDIEDFTPSQRSDFVENYLLSHSADNIGKEAVKGRAAIANEIADGDPSLFAKPVHSKILTDLATDPNFDLSKLQESKSRFLLYQAFIGSLYDRELSKAVRREISDVERISFLRELAFWLWTDKGTSISFSLEELPDRYFSSWFDQKNEDRTGIVRELLSGSILERKQSDVYFFGHRSFAEFLVADRMLEHPPEPSDHSVYSQAFTDGVQLFLTEAKDRSKISNWCDSFSLAKGVIRQNYINFLIDSVGGLDRFKEHLEPSSLWYQILEPYQKEMSVNKTNFDPLIRSLWVSSSVTFAFHFLHLITQPRKALRDFLSSANRTEEDFARQCMFSLINSVTHVAIRHHRYFSIKSEDVGLRRLAQTGIATVETDVGLTFKINSIDLANACVRLLAQEGLPWAGTNDFLKFETELYSEDITPRLDKSVATGFNIFAKHARNFSAIVEVKKRKNFARSRRK